MYLLNYWIKRNISQFKEYKVFLILKKFVSIYHVFWTQSSIALVASLMVQNCCPFNIANPRSTILRIVRSFKPKWASKTVPTFWCGICERTYFPLRAFYHFFLGPFISHEERQSLLAVMIILPRFILKHEDISCSLFVLHLQSACHNVIWLHATKLNIWVDQHCRSWNPMRLHTCILLFYSKIYHIIQVYSHLFERRTFSACTDWKLSPN